MDSFQGVYRKRRVLITGHTGFKGSWLATWLVELGAQVCGYSDGIQTEPSAFKSMHLADLLRHEIGDVRNISRLAEVVEDFKPDFVFHLAAQAIVSSSYSQPLDTISTNVLGTATLLDVLRHLKHPCVGVIITSDKAYENVEWLWGYRENDRLGGKDVYSGSKGAAELIFNSYRHSFFSKSDCVVRLASARAGNVIGGGDWAQDRIVADCIRSWTRGESVSIRSPKATRPWQHVLEPLSGYLALGARLKGDLGLHGESFNFGPQSEQNATVLELLTELACVWGFKDPSEAYIITNDILFHEASLLKLNIDKALITLRWQSTLSYRECVEMTGVWYRDVVKNRGDALTATRDNIRSFEDFARVRKQAWAL